MLNKVTKLWWSVWSVDMIVIALQTPFSGILVANEDDMEFNEL